MVVGSTIEPTLGQADKALDVENLEVVYNDVVLVLRGVSLNIARGAIVTLLGANGAGKTTLLRAVSGLLELHRADATKGSIRLDGHDVTRLASASRVGKGLAQVMEGRRIFTSLTVEENLRSGGIAAASRSEANDTFGRMLEMFPVLARRLHDVAGYLSGGEQQMLAIGRA